MKLPLDHQMMAAGYSLPFCNSVLKHAAAACQFAATGAPGRNMMRGLWHTIGGVVKAGTHKVMRFINTVILQAIKGTLKRDNLMGPCAGKTINDLQDDW